MDILGILKCARFRCHLHCLWFIPLAVRRVFIFFSLGRAASGRVTPCLQPDLPAMLPTTPSKVRRNASSPWTVITAGSALSYDDATLLDRLEYILHAAPSPAAISRNLSQDDFAENVTVREFFSVSVHLARFGFVLVEIGRCGQFSSASAPRWLPYPMLNLHLARRLSRRLGKLTIFAES